MAKEEFLFSQKYRPKTVADCILPDRYKEMFEEYIKTGIPNVLLAGGQGQGKSTIALALLSQVGADNIVINMSMNGNIDTLRNDIRNFASTTTFGESTGRKFVLLDEFDYANPNSLQPGLRNFMEEYSSNCGFIATCNFKNRIIPPLISRFSVIDFKIDKKELPDLCIQFLKRCCNILENENIQFDKKAVAELIMRFAPDWRKVLNELQKYSVGGKIDSGILANNTTEKIEDLAKILKEKRFNDMRKWVANNVDNDPVTLYRAFYDILVEKMDPRSIPEFVVLLADYSYKATMVPDLEVNMAAFLSETMASCEWK
jgi:DNA polymerase III delta prime subunit